MTQQVHVLVVEDREDWQDIICDTLQAAGYIPHPATTYQTAEKLLSQHQFGLAVIDPVLDRTNRFNRDGLSVIQKIIEVQPGIPLIVVTGSLTHDLKASLQRLCPAAPVLGKESWNPIEFTRLAQKLSGQLPAVASDASFSAAAPQTVELSTQLQPPAERPIGRARVLLVEDREDWQNIVGSILSEADYFWRIATSAQEALLEMEKESFHLVILDLKLRQNNLPLRSNEGWLLLDYLVEARPKTKVLILSGQASPGDVADLLTHYPIIGFVEKQHFTPSVILNAVEQAIQAPQLRIQTFGHFRLWLNNRAVGVWEHPQAETVVKLLLVKRARGGRAMAADELIAWLWPDADLESGRKKLLPLISSARHTLEPDIEPRDSNFILRSANGYFFDLSRGVTWDLIEFRKHLRRGRQLVQQGRWTEAISELREGRKLYRGDFLAEDQYADWVMDIRREIAAEYRDLLILLADAHAALKQYSEAIEVCEAALKKDPLMESVYRRLMQFHYCRGEKGQALKVYRDCLTLFEELFGESPTPTTRQLYDAIVSDQPLEC